MYPALSPSSLSPRTGLRIWKGSKTNLSMAVPELARVFGHVYCFFSWLKRGLITSYSTLWLRVTAVYQKNIATLQYTEAVLGFRFKSYRIKRSTGSREVEWLGTAILQDNSHSGCTEKFGLTRGQTCLTRFY